MDAAPEPTWMYSRRVWNGRTGVRNRTNSYYIFFINYNHMHNEYDLAIIGNGMAGASLACCLANQSLRIAIIEQVPPEAAEQPSYDDRGLALSLSSQRILKAIDIWQELAPQAVPIRHIHISDKGRFGLVHLHAAELGLPALGYTVIAKDLGRALLHKTAALENVDVICPATLTDIRNTINSIELDYRQDQQTRTLTCKLLVAADGTGSATRARLGITTRIKDYGQTAIVANISTAIDHDNTAYERFTRQGPLALLPMADNKCVSVYIVASDRADHYLGLDEPAYLDALQQDFGKRLGRLQKLGNRKCYPIRLVQADRQFTERAVLLGNAAHTIHPNGAQGFNLGLRDAAALAEQIVDAIHQRRDPGSHGLLEAYSRSRMDDQSQVIRFTDTLAGLFYNDELLKSAGRNLGMLLLDMSPTLKRRFVRHATGLAGRQAALVRGPAAGLP